MTEISVIVPVHNGESFVERCWQSIASQTRPPCELLFVDDGSTDGTLAAIERLPYAPFHVKVLSQPRRGPAAARNLGVRTARGTLVAFLDIDDRWSSCALALAERSLRDHPSAMAVQGLVQIEYAPSTRATDPRLLEPHRRVNLGSYVFRREVFDLVGMLDSQLTFAEDLDFIGRLRHHGVVVHLVDEVVLHYLRHSQSLTRGRDARDLGMFAAAHNALKRKRGAGFQ